MILAAPEVLELIFGSQYQFLFELEEEEAFYRVAYAEEGWVHGKDDKHLAEKDEIVLGQISPDTDITTFMSNIPEHLWKYVRIYMPPLPEDGLPEELVYERGQMAPDYEGQEADLYICTGWYIKFGSGETPSEKIYLSVLGDVDGDGSLLAGDNFIVKRIIKDTLDLMSLRVEYRLAAYMANMGWVTAGDYAAIKMVSNGTVEITNYYYIPEEVVAVVSEVQNSVAYAAPQMIALQAVSEEEVIEEEPIIAEETSVQALAEDATETVDVAETAPMAETENPETVDGTTVTPLTAVAKYGYTDWDIKEKTL